MIGRTLARYEITAAIGAGGMGEVFRATDTTLGRSVALKVLPPDMARHPERLARFEREARALAALNHPNIVTIHSVEAAEGIHFLTMELVEGESLANLIPPGGMPIERILSMGAALGDALAAAHDKGIVHRDLKPANVMLTTDGRLKVLDFGLAKDVRAADSVQQTLTRAGHTEAGVVMGTPAYMSPEQLAGRTVDHRTDIFSLGIVLYEMATGQRPFDGATSIELASAILRDTPRPLEEVRPNVPADLARVIRRCLEKDPGHRVQTARDIANECRDVARQLVPAGGDAGSGRRAAVSGSSAARPDEGFWIAVVPFKYAGADANLIALAAGLSEEIVTGLSRFSYLRVVSRASTTAGSNETGGRPASGGHAMSARYVLEGSLRQAGSTIRLSVQLVDASTGAHLWAETYDRQFKPDDIFSLQDDLIPRIVSTSADRFGALARSIIDTVRLKDVSELSPYDALMRGFAYHHRLTESEHAEARDVLERAVAQAPSNADCQAMLSWVYSHEFGHGFNPKPGSLDRALAAAQRAVDLSPSSSLAFQALAVARFFRKERAGCLSAAERALALNPLDASNEAMFLIAFAGDWERGCTLIRGAMDLNPHHPGWYRLVLAMNEYRTANYREAVREAVGANVPGIFWTNLVLAAAHGQLGEVDEARDAWRTLLTQQPAFATAGPELLGRWFDTAMTDHMMAGLRLAGGATTAAPASGATISAARPRHDLGFWVAVLPFRCSGGNHDVEALAEGLSEEIVTGLSRFSYLRVIARGSVSRYANQTTDVREIGKEVGARYVIEGSLRQAGSMLRVAVQLVDTSSGSHLWAETYSRAFTPEAIFDLQDDLVPRIVATVADGNGVLPRSMGIALAEQRLDSFTPEQAVIRGWSYLGRLAGTEHAELRAILEGAAEQASDHADVWALLSVLYQDEYRHGFNPRAGSLDRALAAARRAVDLSPTNHFAYHALASTLFFRREFVAGRRAAERSVALNPMDGNTVAYMGVHIAYAGDWSDGLALVERALSLNPHHFGWLWLPFFYDAYRRRDYRAALDAAVKVNMPGYFFPHVALAAAYAQLGEREAARDALLHARRLKPDLDQTIAEELGKWFADRELVGRLIDGLRMAGLEDRKPASPPQRGATGETVARPSSIAVLPFANLSADKEQEYFSDGLADEIINLLAHIDGLRVIARTSSFAFRGKEQDVRRIGEALGVTHVLEGSVRRSGDRLRVTAQLIATADGGQVWSERFDRELRDIFAVQDEIASAMASALRVRLSGQSAQRYVPSLPAYEAYLRARHLQAKVTPEAWDLARGYYESAIDLDPSFALAQIGLGFYWVGVGHFGQSSVHDAVRAARSAAERALGVDRSLPEAHALLGALAAQYDFDWDAAERHFSMPLARQAGHPLTRPAYGGYLFLKGDGEHAIPLAERAIAEDPLDVWLRMNLHAYLQAADRDREALDQVHKVLELDPNQVVARVSEAHIHAAWGELPEALTAARAAYAVGPWYPDTRATLAALLRNRGEQAEAAALYESLGTGEHAGDCRAQAVYHLLAGDIDTGADWTERAIADRDFSMMWYLRFVICRPLRASHRWPAIAKLMNLPA